MVFVNCVELKVEIERANALLLIAYVTENSYRERQERHLD